eukprot:13821886-Alexandrium_andersonii.AAC.1
MPNPPDEALEGDIKGCLGLLGADYGLRIASGLRIAAGLGARPDYRITDYSRTQEDLYQANRTKRRPLLPQ